MALRRKKRVSLKIGSRRYRSCLVSNWERCHASQTSLTITSPSKLLANLCTPDYLRHIKNKPKNPHLTIKVVALLVDNCHPDYLGFSKKIPKSSHHHLRFGSVGWSLPSGLFALLSTWSLEQSTTTRPPSSLTYPSLWSPEACSRYYARLGLWMIFPQVPWILLVFYLYVRIPYRNMKVKIIFFKYHEWPCNILYWG